MKLWDKGYKIDLFTEQFTIGKDRVLDIMLAKADVIGNLAHLEMLCGIGLLSEIERDTLRGALLIIYEKIEAGKFVIDSGIEDIHSQVELLLTELCGDTGKKIHTGRSRNDQVLLDIKLFTRHRLFELVELVGELFELLLKRAEESKGVLIPGYTHLQIAMPSSFGLWFSAYAESLTDDLIFLKAAYDMVNTNPLGSGAGYGSSIPLNRALTTKLLGFEDLAYNSIYAQMQRGKMERNVLFALASVATTLGRLAADICLFASGNFSFVKLPDCFTTGSSIMPHKKNPDIFELIRGKCNLLQALPNQMAMLCANLTSGYFRDMQLTKEIYLPAFKELNDSLYMATIVLKEMELCEGVVEEERYQYLFTVEDVNRLVALGIPFRDAYREVGMKIQSGEYKAGDRTLQHTHEGSIGNLCLDNIKAKYDRYLRQWDFQTVIEAEKALLNK